MRKAAAVVVIACFVLSLAACTVAPAAAACAPTPSGPASTAVTVTGAFGSKPKVHIVAPVSVKKTERTVLITGKGKAAVTGDEVKVDFTLYNANSGAELTATDYTAGKEQSFVVNTKLYLAGLIKTIHCSPEGSRVVGVIPPKDSWGNVGSEKLGVAADESIVFVADIVTVLPGRATGATQPATSGLPKVTVASDGTPTVTIPKADPPTDLKIEVLKKGNGKILASGDTVRFQYVGVNWSTGQVFDETWGHANPVTSTTDSSLPGFNKAIIGQTVNSQVLVVVPPSDGYGATGGPDGSGIGPTDTLVFVIDILPTK
jgi:FKBP-type peptidyl-prolyl cis-trans isomerase